MCCVETGKGCTHACALRAAHNKNGIETPVVFRLLDPRPMHHPQYAAGVHDGYFKNVDSGKLECKAYLEGTMAGMEFWDRMMSLSESERKALVIGVRRMPRHAWELLRGPQPKMESLSLARSYAAGMRAWDSEVIARILGDADFVVRLGAVAIPARH